MSQFNPVPNPVNDGKKTAMTDEEARDNLDMGLASYASQQANSIVTGARFYDSISRQGKKESGEDAIKGYFARMDTFAKAFEDRAHTDIQAGEKIRLDVATSAEKHANNNAFFVESVHEGAWEQARSMTSDEHHGFLGTDLRARNQFMHDASQNSDIAKILGLENSPEFLAAVAARGVDTNKEGSYEDSITNPFQSLLNYDDISDMVAKRTDSAWTAAAQDNAWEAMNSSSEGRYLLAATGIKRETLSRFTNQDALIYGMNRMYKEAKFQQHASSDDWGGMLENFGQMLPTIINDPDTIGEVGLALMLAIPSGGASVYVGAAAKAGTLGKNALRIQKVAKGLATAGRLLPTRVLGDFVVPGVKALGASRKAREITTTSARLRHAWNNLDAYDNWITFAMGASADGSVGGVGAFLMNTQRIDDLNAVVYGRGVVPSVRTFDMVAMRGLMGVAGAVTLGSALRASFKGLAMGADKTLKMIQESGYGDIKGQAAKAEASRHVTSGITRKILAQHGIEDEAIIGSTSAGIERDAARAGVAPHIVAARIRDEVDMDGITGEPAEKAALIREWAHEIILDEFMKPAARDARFLRTRELEKQLAKGKTVEARVEAEDALVRDRIQTGAMITAHGVKDQTTEGLGNAAQEIATNADPLMDDLYAANTRLDDARAESNNAREDADLSKRERKMSEEEKDEDLKKQQEAAKARNEQAKNAKDKQVAETEKAVDEAKSTAQKADDDVTARTEEAAAARNEADEAMAKAEVAPTGKAEESSEPEVSVDDASFAESAINRIRGVMAQKNTAAGLTPEGAQAKLDDIVIEITEALWGRLEPLDAEMARQIQDELLKLSRENDDWNLWTDRVAEVFQRLTEHRAWDTRQKANNKHGITDIVDSSEKGKAIHEAENSAGFQQLKANLHDAAKNNLLEDPEAVGRYLERLDAITNDSDALAFRMQMEIHHPSLAKAVFQELPVSDALINVGMARAGVRMMTAAEKAEFDAEMNKATVDADAEGLARAEAEAKAVEDARVAKEAADAAAADKAAKDEAARLADEKAKTARREELEKEQAARREAEESARIEADRKAKEEEALKAERASIEASATAASRSAKESTDAAGKLDLSPKFVKDMIEAYAVVKKARKALNEANKTDDIVRQLEALEAFEAATKEHDKFKNQIAAEESKALKEANARKAAAEEEAKKAAAEKEATEKKAAEKSDADKKAAEEAAAAKKASEDAEAARLEAEKARKAAVEADRKAAARAEKTEQKKNTVQEDNASSETAVALTLHGKAIKAEARVEAAKTTKTKADAEVTSAQTKADEVSSSKVETEDIPTTRVPLTETGKKDAKKKMAETSQEVHTAQEAVNKIREKIRRRLNVSEDEVDAVAALVVSHRMLSSAASRANDVVDGFEKEGFEDIPAEVLRHILVEISPTYARRFDGEDLLTLEEARHAIEGARVVGQGENFRGLTEDPNAIFMASRFTRGSYEAIAKQIRERQEEGPAGAYKAAAQMKLITGGGSLKDYAFRGSKMYLEGAPFVEKAIHNLKGMVDNFEALEIKVDAPLKKLLKQVEAEMESVPATQQKITLRQELESKFGYPSEVLQKSDITPEHLVALVAYHRFVDQFDTLVKEGKVDPENLILMGIDKDQQKIYFLNVLDQVERRISEARDGGHDRFIDEVEMLSVARAYFGPHTSAGANLRDSIFHPARAANDSGRGRFDLFEVRRIAEERLARVDADFNRARQMAANVELARLEGKEKDGDADFSDRIRLAQYRSKVKAINEIDYLEERVIAPYRAVSQEAAAKRREELGEEGWAAYLRDQEDQLYLGARAALFGNHGLDETARNDMFRRHGVPVPLKGHSPTEQWKTDVAPLYVRLAAKELGFKSPMDLVDGTQGFVGGNQAGMALVLMNRDNASLSGSTAKDIKADSKVRSRGEAYAHTAFSAARRQNPTGNLKVQRQVRMIEEFMLHESERQILFNEDGSPRELDIEDSRAIIDYYEGMKDWDTDKLQDNVPDHPFEQKARGLHLVARKEKALGSPVQAWETPKQKADEYQRKLLQDPVNLHQGIHDDLTLMVKEGVALNDMGAVGPMTMRNSQGRGTLDGLGAGWQTVAAVPGSIMDWLNIRSGMIFRQFDGMDAFARAIGLESLKEMREAIVTSELLPRMHEGEVEIPQHIADLKGPALKEAAKAAGVKTSQKVGEIRKQLALKEAAAGTKTEAEAREAAELLTLVELDNAVRKVDQVIREQAFKGGTLADPKKFEEELNSWDAASQAVSLAKGLLNAALFAAHNQAKAKPDANTGSYSHREMKAGIDEVMKAMGWDKKEGLLTQDIRMEMLRNKARTQDVSSKLADEDLAEVAADFYSKVWDGMVNFKPDPEHPEFKRMSGRFTDEDSGEVVPTDFAYGSGRYVGERDAERGEVMWNHLFDSIGTFGSKQEIGEGRGSSDPEIAALSNMKKFLRDKLMKRPVMTRAYGAGGDAMTNAIADFLEEAFSFDTPEAADFRALIRNFDEQLADDLESNALSGNRQANSTLYQVASSLGWAFADKAHMEKWKGEGGAMGAILDMPDARTFRDIVRNMNSLHKDAFNLGEGDKNIDLQINWRGRDVGVDSVKVSEGEQELRNITLDELYSQRSIEDTVWEKEPKPKEKEDAKDRIAREQRNAEATRDNINDLYEQVKEKAISVALRRGWSDSYPEETLATIGRWHMRNLMLIKTGTATSDQVAKAEAAVSERISLILEKSDNPMTELRDFFENWLARRDELTIRAMNSIGFKMRNEEVDGALASVGLRPDDLDPKFALARQSGAQLHSSVHSSAGRGWTGGGQGGKGFENKENPDRSIRPVYRARSDEHPAPAWDLDNTVARDWQKSSFEERSRIAAQLSAQDLMIDFLGIQKPPLHLIRDSPAYKEPTVEDFFRDWAANEHRAIDIRDNMEIVREEWRGAYRKEHGKMPHELQDILWDDIRSQVPSSRTHTLFGQEGKPDVMTDAGIPQTQVFRLKRTADVVLRSKIKAVRDNKVTGAGISLSELAVPATLKFAAVHNFIMRDPAPASAIRSFDGDRMETDLKWLSNWTWREVTDFANSIGIEVNSKNSFGEVFRLMHMERAWKMALNAGESKMKATDNGEGLDLETPEGRKGFMDVIQRDINSYLEELMGGETEVAAKKEAGTRDVQQIPDTGTAYPGGSLLGTLRNQYVLGGRDDGPNWMHADAVLGPAHREGIILKGSNTTSGALITGIMSKTVFGNDFGVGMGAAEESVRFGHWFIMEKFGVTREEAAFKFNEYAARRLEDDADGAYYQKKLQQWQSGEVGENWMPNNLTTLMGLGSVRETLYTDPEAWQLAQRLFGIHSREELTEDFMNSIVNDNADSPGGVKVLKVEGLGDSKRRPMAYMDSLGRDLTLTRIPATSVLWRTMSMYRNSGIDPKSQPMVRRMWFAAMLEMKVEKLDMVGRMGARETNSRAFSHLAPDQNGKVSDQRLEASHAAISQVTGGANKWGQFSEHKDAEGNIVRRKTSLQGLAEARGGQLFRLLEDAGIDFELLHKTLNDELKARIEAKEGRRAYDHELYPPIRIEYVDETGRKFNIITNEAKAALWAFYVSGRDMHKMKAIGEYASRGVRDGLESMTDAPAGALERGGLTDGEGRFFYSIFNRMESGIDENVLGQLKRDVEALMSDSADGDLQGVSRLRIDAVLSMLPERKLITAAGAEKVAQDIKTGEDAKLITEGKPDNHGPIFGNNRTVINEFDKIIREKRYPALNTLIKQLDDENLFKDEAARREFGLMMAMNMDLLGDLLPGVKFSYVGETGTARMQTIVTNSTREMLHRVTLLKDIKDMDGIEVFDLVAHELSHAIVHRGMANRKGLSERNKNVNRLMTSLQGQYRRRILKGEGIKDFNDAFVAIYGEEKGNVLFKKFYDDVSSGDGNRMQRAAQEFSAQFMSWFLLSRTNTDDVANRFGPELATLYRAGFGERLRRVAKLYEEPGMEAKGVRALHLQPARVLSQLATIANTAEPVRWSGKQAFNQEWYNHSSNVNSEEALLRARAEVVEASKTADEVDLPMLRNKWVSINNRLQELGHATPSERVIASVQKSMLTPDRKSTITAMRNSDLSIEERSSLVRRLEAGETIPHEEFGRVKLDGFTEGEKNLIIDHMIDGKIAGRRETVGDSKFRNVAMMAGEGIALQGTSSAWRSSYDENGWAANLLNPMLGFENRSAANAHDMGMSQQEIHLLQRSLYGKAVTAAIELFDLAQKKDGAFVKAVDDAFEETFRGGPDSDAALSRLAEQNAHAANLVETAAKEFAKMTDRAYLNAVQVGDMKKWVTDGLVGDGNRQLPIQLSQIVKEDSAMRTMSVKVGTEIRAEQIRRLVSDPSTGERAGFVNAQFLHDYGIMAPWKTEMSPTERARHVDTLDHVYGSELVDQITDEGKLHIRDDFDMQFGGNRADEFFLASQVLQEKMEGGEYHAGDMAPALRDAYRRAMEGDIDPAVMTNSKDEPFYMRHLHRDFPDPDDQAKFRAILINGSERVDPADYEAMKMLYRSRHGGYSFADSRFMSANAFRDVLNQGLEGRGINRTPINVIKTFMAFDHGIMDKFFNQEYYGITGFGYSDLLKALKRRTNRARLSENGTMVKLSQQDQAQALKEIESLEAQHKLAMGRNPKYKDDAGDDLINAIAPTIQTAVGLATTPNWTTASLVVEGTAGLVNRAAKMFTEGTKFTLPKYAGDMGAMRDSMHAIGITMPYHMTKLGFGHIWNMGEEASAAMDLDPSLKESFHDKTNKKLRRMGSFAFERVQLAQREAEMIPSQQLLRKMLIPDGSGQSKVMRLAGAYADWRVKNPDGEITREVIMRLAKEHGVKKDVASQMHAMGLLSPEMARRVSEMANEFMPSNTFLKYEDMFDSVSWKPDREAGEGNADILRSGKAATGLQQLLFNQVSKTNMEPKVGTTNVNAGPLVRMWQQLSQYSILFMRETMSSLASTGLGATAALLMPLYFGEVMWYSLNRMKNGDSPQKIMEDWRTDAPGQMITALARMPVLGAGSFLNDIILGSAMSTIGKLSDGAVFGSKANERAFGMNTPGMPGPSMMIQSITAFSDLVKQGGSALIDGDPAEAGRQAKEFLYKYGPAEFRPILVAGLRTATSDWKEAGKTPKSRLVPNLRVPQTFGALPEFRGHEPTTTRAQARARDYGQLKAEALTGSKPLGTGNPTGDASSASQPSGTSQTGSSGLSGPIKPQTSGAMGPGSAGGPLMDKFGK